MSERTNEQWLADLRGPNPEEALGDLYEVLVRGLKAGLRTSGGGVEASAGDSLLTLSSFRPPTRGGTVNSP